MSDPERTVTWLRELVAQTKLPCICLPDDELFPYCTNDEAGDRARNDLFVQIDTLAALLADALELVVNADPLSVAWRDESRALLARAAESFPGTKEERG